MLKIYESSEAEKKYIELKPELKKKYQPDDYVVINPRTGKYFVDRSSVGAVKKARKQYPTGKLFLAQVGRMAGFMK
ncbi:hypothetical protein HYS11_00780 [Candidatus Gottesmanbacteria bacterium]|nr:hypothetical protein [Candidatus Gottesmanbacteria bacterium]